MELNFSGACVLVTGAGQGLGMALADAFADEGANVVYHYLTSAEPAQSAAAEAAKRHGTKCIAAGADITNTDQVAALIAKINDEIGPVNVLINNAAFTGLPTAFITETKHDWQRQLDVTLGGLFEVTQAVLPGMVEAGGGAIVTIAGESGRVGESLAAVTSATRAGALGFTKALAKEVARHNIRANAVTLGLIDTPTTRATVFDVLDEQVIDRIRRNYVLRRFGEAEDVTGVVMLLASERSGWVTGQTYPINGGYSMFG